jgi:hypothetical protein
MDVQCGNRQHAVTQRWEMRKRDQASDAAHETLRAQQGNGVNRTPWHR